LVEYTIVKKGRKSMARNVYGHLGQKRPFLTHILDSGDLAVWLFQGSYSSRPKTNGLFAISSLKVQNQARSPTL